MKLTDLEQRLIVPITDQTRGGIQYEVEISLEELLKGTLEDFEPEIVEAVPVEWLWAAQNKMLKSQRYNFEQCAVVGQLIRAWQKEQGART